MISGRLFPDISASRVSLSLPSGEMKLISAPVFSVMTLLTALPPQGVLYQLKFTYHSSFTGSSDITSAGNVSSHPAKIKKEKMKKKIEKCFFIVTSLNE